MKKFFITIVTLLLTLGSNAQTAREEIRQDRLKACSNYMPYPGPQQKQLTKAPKGYKPFHLSHYGRHGSRYIIGMKGYNEPYEALLKADSLGKLTEKGKKVLGIVARARQDAMGRDGELTLLGAQQHRGIARRMYQRFPELFKGDTHIDAKSTIVIRCILSMENALLELTSLNPKLRFTHDASEHDMYFMNSQDKKVSEPFPKTARDIFNNYTQPLQNPMPVMNLLFNDMAYVEKTINANALTDRLFNLCADLENTELRHETSLWDLFSEEEIYNQWARKNAWWYINYGPSPLNGGIQPYSQKRLLNQIMHEADSCMSLKKPGVMLRYGHDTMVMPLACLLGVNEFGVQTEDLGKITDLGWRDYNIFPMACNFQFIFYRRHPGDKDILVKVLFNENEARLPVKTDCAPYYRWNDFKNYYKTKLDAFKMW